MGVTTRKGKDDLVRQREPRQANVIGGAVVNIVTDSPLGPCAVVNVIGGRFFPFWICQLDPKRGPLLILGCVLWTASQPTVAG